MTLHSIQSLEAFEVLQNQGRLITDPSMIDTCYQAAYQWMSLQMSKRLGTKPADIEYPVWAWEQYNNSIKKKPDLRNSGLVQQGKNAVRIEINVDESRVLLSDFHLWHYVLNQWYLSDNLDDVDNEFSYRDKELSWQRIFDLDWECPDIAFSKDRKAIQAMFWELRISDVIDYTYFVGR